MGVKEDLEILDKSIARLKMEYDQYFARTLKYEPYKLKTEIEQTIFRYSAANIRNTALKFKYNSLVARFNAYKNYWNRMFRDMDLAASKPVHSEKEYSKETPYNYKKIDQLYLEYIKARKKCNQDTDNLSPEGLARAVKDKFSKFKEKGIDKDMDIKVVIKNGKAVLSIASKESTSDKKR